MDSDTKGGAEEYLYHLYQHLVRDKELTVDLFGYLPNWSNDLGLVTNLSKGTKLTTTRGTMSQIVGAALYSRRLKKSIDLSKYDIIHIQFMKEKLFLPWKFFRSGKVIWTEHGPLPASLPSIAYPILRRRAKRSTVVAVSASTRESLIQQKIECVVLRNPFPEIENAKRTDEFSHLGEPIIAFAGRIHPAKRIHLLQEVASQNPQWTFIIAGTGPDYENLTSQQTENFKVIGHIENVADLLESAHVLVVTSGKEAREGFPLVALEARILGTHVAMALDCHAALEAAEIGVELFLPTADGLESLLQQIISKNRKSYLSEMEIKLRTTDNWASAYYELFEELISLNTK